MTMDLDLTDGQAHQVTLYNLDYDSTVRSQRIDILDGETEAVLDSRTVSGFHDGRYLVWEIRGHVKIKVTRTGGANAVVSGLFFDSPQATANLGQKNDAGFLTDTIQ